MESPPPIEEINTTNISLEKKGTRDHRKSYTCSFKLEVVEYAEKYSNSKASEYFNVHRRRVQEWKNQKQRLVDQVKNYDGSTKRLKGGGRKLKLMNDPQSQINSEADIEPYLTVKLLNFTEKNHKGKLTPEIVLKEAKKINPKIDCGKEWAGRYLEEFLVNEPPPLQRRLDNSPPRHRENQPGRYHGKYNKGTTSIQMRSPQRHPRKRSPRRHHYSSPPRHLSQSPKRHSRSPRRSQSPKPFVHHIMKNESHREDNYEYVEPRKYEEPNYYGGHKFNERTAMRKETKYAETPTFQKHVYEEIPPEYLENGYDDYYEISPYYKEKMKDQKRFYEKVEKDENNLINHLQRWLQSFVDNYVSADPIDVKALRQLAIQEGRKNAVLFDVTDEWVSQFLELNEEVYIHKTKPSTDNYSDNDEIEDKYDENGNIMETFGKRLCDEDNFQNMDEEDIPIEISARKRVLQAFNTKNMSIFEWSDQFIDDDSN